MSSITVIALDVGGSSIKAGRVHLPDQVTNLVTYPLDSQASADFIISELSSAILTQQAWADDPMLRSVALSFPGPCDYVNGMCWIEGLEKFGALYGVHVPDALRAHLRQPNLDIRLRNDAEAAVLGEVRFGIGCAYQRVIGLTLGTGFGSAFIVDGRVVVEGTGVPANGWLYPLRVSDQRADDTFSTRGLLHMLHHATNVDEDALTIPSAAAAARAGSVAEKEVFQAFGASLGAFLRPHALDFAADAIVLQGGIAGAYDLFGGALQTALNQPDVAVCVGMLGNKAALLGAAALFSD